MSRWIAVGVALVCVSSSASAQENKRVEHTVEAAYAAELSSFSDGTTSAGVAAVGAEIDYQASLLDDEGQPTYDMGIGAGLTVGRMQGTISATQVSTRAHLRFGPAAVSASENRGNLAWFPLTFELDGDGDLAALPRLSSRPDANRALYDRGQLALATRLVRVEVGETKTSKGDRAPGETPPDEPVSSAIDVITLFGDAEATGQDGTRIEGGFGGAMLSVTNRYTRGERVDVFAVEHRASKLPDGSTTSIATLWMLRAEFENAATGSTYTLGWGVAIGGPYDELAPPTEDNPDPDLNIGGIGWWSDRSWGGVGFQYLRQPYVTMAGEPALDDRVWVEAWRAGKLQLKARGFFANTRRAREGMWSSEWSSGVELGAQRDIRGVTVDLTLEAGQTHYAEVDGGRPELGFATRGQLSLRRSGRRTWSR